MGGIGIGCGAGICNGLPAGGWTDPAADDLVFAFDSVNSDVLLGGSSKNLCLGSDFIQKAGFSNTGNSTSNCTITNFAAESPDTGFLTAILASPSTTAGYFTIRQETGLGAANTNKTFSIGFRADPGAATMPDVDVNVYDIDDATFIGVQTFSVDGSFDRLEYLVSSSYTGQRLIVYIYPDDDMNFCDAQWEIGSSATAYESNFKGDSGEVIAVQDDSLPDHILFPVLTGSYNQTAWTCMQSSVQFGSNRAWHGHASNAKTQMYLYKKDEAAVAFSAFGGEGSIVCPVGYPSGGVSETQWAFGNGTDFELSPAAPPTFFLRDNVGIVYSYPSTPNPGVQLVTITGKDGDGYYRYEDQSQATHAELDSLVGRTMVTSINYLRWGSTVNSDTAFTGGIRIYSRVLTQSERESIAGYFDDLGMSG